MGGEGSPERTRKFRLAKMLRLLAKAGEPVVMSSFVARFAVDCGATLKTVEGYLDVLLQAGYVRVAGKDSIEFVEGP